MGGNVLTSTLNAMIKARQLPCSKSKMETVLVDIPMLHGRQLRNMLAMMVLYYLTCLLRSVFLQKEKQEKR